MADPRLFVFGVRTGLSVACEDPKRFPKKCFEVLLLVAGIEIEPISDSLSVEAKGFGYFPSITLKMSGVALST